MTIQERTKDLIIQLKKVKEREGLTNSAIVRMVEENGDFISISTVSRIMAEGSENNPTFRYHDTLKPIAKVLLGLDTSHLEGLSDEERGIKDVALIKEMEIHEKDLQIEQLTKRLQEIEADTRKKISYLSERVEYLKEQVAIRQAEIARKDEQIAARDSQIAERDNSIRKKDEMIDKLSDGLLDLFNQSKNRRN